MSARPGFLMTPITAWALACAEESLDGPWASLGPEAWARAEQTATARGWMDKQGFLSRAGSDAVDEVLAAYVAAYGEPVEGGDESA